MSDSDIGVWCRVNWIETPPNEGCQNNRDRALGNIRTPKMESECSIRDTFLELSSVLQEKENTITVAKRETRPLNRGNLFLIVKRVISFFCAHGTYARRRTAKHYEIWWGNPSTKVKMDNHVFWCIDTAWYGYQRWGKNTSICWEHVPCVRLALRMGHFSRGELRK